MYASETEHLYPSLQECPVCQRQLKEYYRTKERIIKTLNGKRYIVSHVFICENSNCSNNKKTIRPEEETLLVIKGYTYGLDVIVKIGNLRYSEHKTWEKCQEILAREYGLKISLREIGHLESAYLALTKIVAKKDESIIEKLKSLEGLIIAIDGIKPDGSNEVLYLIRELQTGLTLIGAVLEQSDNQTIGELLEEVIALGYPILGIVSDKQESIVLAIKNKLPNTPHQLCQIHYLKNLALPLTEEDSKLKKKIASSLAREVRAVEKKLTNEETISQMSDEEISVARDYCLTIKILLKEKSLYPLKPGGIALYQNLMKVRQSLQHSLKFQSNFLLQKLLCLLNIITSFSSDIQRLQLAYSWLYKIASLLKCQNCTQAQAKLKLLTYLNSLSHSHDSLLCSWIAKFKKVTFAWIDGLFQCLSLPLLPRTNNSLENFNGSVKKTHRHITGRKNTQSFISRLGSNISFLLALPQEFDLILKFSSVPYSEFRHARDSLSHSELRKKIYAIRHSLDDFLFDLEVRWTSHSPNISNIDKQNPIPPLLYKDVS